VSQITKDTPIPRFQGYKIWMSDNKLNCQLTKNCWLHYILLYTEAYSQHKNISGN